MVAFLAMRIIKGYLTYEQVPASLKDQVAQQLRQQDREDLITAESEG